MATHASTSSPVEVSLAPSIRSKLAGLRRRIRLYVWIEGICLALLWVALTFWLMLGLDYLVVYSSGYELPVWARAYLLLRVGMVLSAIVIFWLLARAFVRLPDHSMAVLLERRFRDFGDSLVTAVEMNDEPEHARQFNRDMLANANQRATSRIDSVRLNEVFNWRRLAWRAALVVLLILPAAAVWGDTLKTGFDRLYLLKDVTWPRNAQIEIVGLQVQRSTADPNVAAPPMVRFQNRAVKVARHSNLTLHVRADVTAPRVPEFCTIYYTTDDGERGRVNMKKIGRPRDDFQRYSFDEKPFQGILSSMTFMVRGDDHRVRDFRIDVVDNPAIVETELDCEFPDYMVDPALSQWLPRTLRLTNSTQLPLGTRLVIRARCNKPLERVVVVDTESQQTTEVSIDPAAPDQFSYEVDGLAGNLALDVTLFDTDGVVTDKPHRIFIAAVEDEPPRVDVVLRGIGTAVTPDVVIPAQGTVSDDYAIDKVDFVATVDDVATEFPVPLLAGGKIDSELDFREERAKEGGMQLAVGGKLTFSVKASDKYNLGDSTPNVGLGDAYQLEVVSPDQLLAILERRELGLRQRFEQIIDEVTAMRDSLARVKSDVTGGDKSDVAEPDAGDQPQDEEARRQRARSLRLLWTQRALIQSQKSAQEVLGVAGSFDDIRQELLNNRVDSEDRKTRLQEQIAEPLHQIGQTMFPDLDQLLEDLETNLDDAAKGPEAAALALDQADDILTELDKVLQKMLELETFNELVDIVRDLIEQQKKLIESTEQERKRQALELLK